jgi:DNA replication protein DnaD
MHLEKPPKLCTTIISTLRKLRQEDPKFETTISKTNKALPQKKKNKRNKEKEGRKEGKDGGWEGRKEG